MKTTELKEKAISEIENCLQHLGADNDSVFPHFDLDSHELEYGCKREGDEILIETRGRLESGEPVLIRVNISTTIGV